MRDTLFPDPVRTDLLLVFPPFQRPIVSMENIGIEYIAAYARSRGFAAVIVNAGLHGLTVDDVVRLIRQSSFRVLGISTLHWNSQAALEIAMAARFYHPGCHIVLGGIEAALNAEHFLAGYPFLDSVCLGEGEAIVAELLAALAGGRDWRQIRGLAYRERGAVVVNEAADLVASLDTLPFPARDDVAAVIDSGGPVSIGTSRGCFGSCPFCSVRAFYNLSRGTCWRGRSPASVVAEIRALHDTFGVTLFSFVDETVAGPGADGVKRLREIARRIRSAQLEISFFMTIRADQVEAELFRELQLAGLKKVEIGIESMAESQLRRYGKTCGVEDNRRALGILDELGILSEAFMIPFDSETTYPEVACNLSFYGERFGSRSRGYDVAPLTMGDYLYPYPGTAIRARYERNGWLGQGWHTPFRAHDPVVQGVQQTVQWFIAAAEPAFPLSYAGLGNLWVNSRGLPEAVHRKTCRIAAMVGTLLVDVAAWAYETLAGSAPLSPGEIEAVAMRLGAFIERATRLKGELQGVVAEFGMRADDHDNPLAAGNTFAGQLYRFGKAKRRELVAAMYRDCGSDNAIIPLFTELLSVTRKQACHD
ncbi:MAG TPA: radical SAM protein [Geobacteraceae bacterium]